MDFSSQRRRLQYISWLSRQDQRVRIVPSLGQSVEWDLHISYIRRKSSSSPGWGNECRMTNFVPGR